MLLIMAYGGYLLADRLGASGPLETVTAGILAGIRSRRVMSPTTRLQAGATWEFLDFLANSFLFLLVGLELRLVTDLQAPHLGLGILVPLAAVFIAITLARALTVWLVAHLLRRVGQPLPQGWRTIITWAGLRGAVSLAAALSLPASLPQRDLLIVLTFGVVLITLLGQGLTVRGVLERVGLVRRGGAQAAMEHALARLQAAEAGARELAILREAHALTEADADRLAAAFEGKQAAARADLNAALAEEPTLAAEQERAAREHLLHVQREAVRAAAASGQISTETMRAISSTLDRHLDEMRATESA